MTGETVRKIAWNTLLAVVLVIALWRLAAPAISAPPRVPAVANETARSGWPHPVTAAEIVGVQKTVFKYEIPTPSRKTASIICRNQGQTIQKVTCRLRDGQARWTAYVRVARNGALTIRRGPVTANETPAFLSGLIGTTMTPVELVPTDPKQLVYAQGAQSRCGGDIEINPDIRDQWLQGLNGGPVEENVARLVLHEYMHRLSGGSCDPMVDRYQDEAIVDSSMLSVLAPWSAEFTDYTFAYTAPDGMYAPRDRDLRKQITTITGAPISSPTAKRFLWRLLVADQAGRDAMLAG